MTQTVTVRGLSKGFRGGVVALDDVDLDLREGRIHGLLGRNGAGKTTLMQILAGHAVPDSGSVLVFGEEPYENERVVERISFVREGQRYPDHLRVHQVLSAAEGLLPNWDGDFARRLMDDFRLPRDRRVKRLSRGMLSALGIVVGLASRAPLTLFDEPYLGLDAVARQIFYDRLLADYSEHPRTVLLSTHLIDEVANLVEDVTVIDGGRVVLSGEADELRGRAVTVTGGRRAAEEFADGRIVLHREELGGTARLTLAGPLDEDDHAEAADRGLRVEPVTLQQLVVRTTAGPAPAREEVAR